jgi:hypothetical protein
MVQWSGWESLPCAHQRRRKGHSLVAPLDRAKAKPSVIPVPAALHCGCHRRTSGTGAALSAIRHGGLRSMSRAAMNIDRTLDTNAREGRSNEDST